MSNSSAKYYQKQKRKVTKRACKRYQNLPEEEQAKARLHVHDQYKNFPELEKSNRNWNNTSEMKEKE